VTPFAALGGLAGNPDYRFACVRPAPQDDRRRMRMALSLAAPALTYFVYSILPRAHVRIMLMEFQWVSVAQRTRIRRRFGPN
jgi:hypothetical protein